MISINHSLLTSYPFVISHQKYFHTDSHLEALEVIACFVNGDCKPYQVKSHLTKRYKKTLVDFYPLSFFSLFSSFQLFQPFILFSIFSLFNLLCFLVFFILLSFLYFLALLAFLALAILNYEPFWYLGNDKKNKEYALTRIRTVNCRFSSQTRQIQISPYITL